MTVRSINNAKKYSEIMNINKNKLISEIILIFHFNPNVIFYIRYFVAGYLSMCDRLCSTNKQIINILTGTCLEGYISGNENSDHKTQLLPHHVADSKKVKGPSCDNATNWPHCFVKTDGGILSHFNCSSNI